VNKEIIFALLVAPFVGSFLGVVVERLPAGRPIALARDARSPRPGARCRTNAKSAMRKETH
jgi:hypothetical protein